MLKLSKNNAGFTLMEIVIAAGLLGFLAIGFLKFQQNQMKSTKTSINKVEINNFFQAMRGYLAKPGTCKKTFESLGSIDNELVLNEILRVDGEVKYAVGDKINGTNYKLSSLSLTDIFINRKEGEEFHRGEALLNIELSRYNNTSYGGKSIKKTVEIDMYVDNSNYMYDCGVLGGIYIPIALSSNSDKDSEESEVANDDSIATKDSLDETFEESVKEASLKTGVNISQDKIKKVIESNPQLIKAMESIKTIRESNKKLEAVINESN